MAVIHTHSKDVWSGPVAEFSGSALPQVIDKLRNKSLLHILLFGDSIAAEFILVTSILLNPESEFAGTQMALSNVLKELSGPGIALADMTS